MKHDEYIICCKIAGMLDTVQLANPGMRYTHVPLEEADKMRAIHEEKMGVRKGCPDFLVFWNPPVAMEVKTANGATSKEQRAWLVDLERSGWRTAIVRSSSDAMRFLRSVYGARLDGEGVEEL